MPSTIRVRYTGKLQPYVTSKDLILATLREIGVDYAQGYAIGKPSPFESHT